MLPLRLLRGAGAVLAATTLAVVSPLAPLPASAHRDPTIDVRIVEVRPDLPRGVRLDVLDGERTYLGLANNTATAMDVLDPEGRPFLRVSTAGVFGDVKSRFLAVPREVAESAAAAPSGCCPEAGWRQLSDRPRWSWPDPRLDPLLRDPGTTDARGLGALASAGPLAVWAVTLRYGRRTSFVNGVVERRDVGSVTTTVDSAPPGVKVSVIQSRPPQLRIDVDGGTRIDVVGRDHRAFIRVGASGAFGLTQSADYQASRRAMGLPPREGSEWMPIAGAGPATVTWADPRLDYQSRLPSDDSRETVLLDSWRIPVVVNGHSGEIRGRSVWKRAPVPAIALAPKRVGFWKAGNSTTYAVAGGLTLALVAVAALARRRMSQREVSGEDVG